MGGMLSDQLQEALSERRSGEMDTRARERFAEVVMTNLQAIRRSGATVNREQRRILDKAVSATKAFLKVWARRMGVGLHDIDIDPVRRPPAESSGIRMHLTALAGAMDRVEGADYAVSLLQRAERDLRGAV
jgi:hypothetical protein